MAIEKVIDIQVNSNLDSITKDVKKLGNSFEDTSDEIKVIQKSTKNAEAGIKSMSDGFKGMGLAIKAIGIGLVMEAFNLFKEVLGKNQKIVDLFNTAIGALSIAFNDLVGFVADNFPAVIKIFKDVFENPTKYLQKFGDLIKENLIERFNSFLDTVGYLGTALKKVFEGDFAGAMESVKQAGKESIDVLTGVNNTFDRGKKAIVDAADAISNYAVKTFKASEANVKLQNSAILAAAEQGRLVEQYDRQAEKLRQIRDNDLLAIDDRIKANNELKSVLEEQQIAMINKANLQVQAARANYEMNKTIANQAAITQSLSDKEGVLAQIEGLRSEQIANSISLQKEKIALGQTEIENLNALAIEQKKFNESLEIDELKKLENQRANLEEEKTIEQARLQLKIDSAALGTQARIDAENEYAVKTQEIDNAITTNKIESIKAANEKEVEFQKNKDNAIAASKQNLNNIIAGLEASGLNKSKAGQAISKAIALTQIGIDSAVAISKASTLANAEGVAAQLAFPLVPGIGTIARITSYAATAATVIGNIARAKQLLSGGGGGGSSAPSGGGGGSTVSGGASTPPSFNVVGASGTNQLAQSIGAQQQQPIQAYVVANNVTTAQALNRNIIESATIGG